MAKTDTDYTTPSAVRAVTSYPARRMFNPPAIDPFDPAIPGVKGAIDIHCHATVGQQDPLGLAKLASISGMRGILFKTITDRKEPAKSAAKVQNDLNAWADKEGVTPIDCWAGCSVTEGYTVPIRVERSRELLDSGCIALWMPNVNAANTLSIVGGRVIMWDKTAAKTDHSDPLPWEEALKRGHYLLDDNGKLKTHIEEIFRMSADRGTAIFFGHPSKPELWAMADLCVKLNYKRGVIDHPFSPFVNLTLQEMADAGTMGLWINFTYDEISPLLGIDPARMYEAIRTIGVDHCTLSSDCGEPLFPNSVEGMRMMHYYMSAFGCTDAEIHQMITDNPAFIVGLDQSTGVRAAAAE
ncbi:MAG: hypothetical protein ACI82H_000185 [Alphaproteobacteria bacterium]|jgi:hypothetical protein